VGELPALAVFRSALALYLVKDTGMTSMPWTPLSLLQNVVDAQAISHRMIKLYSQKLRLTIPK